MSALFRNTTMYGTPTCLSQEDVLPGLWHGTICSTDYQNGPVHLGSASYHVLYVVSVPWAVNVCVVAVGRSVLLVRGSDSYAPLAFLRGVVYLVESDLTVGWVVRDLLGQDPGNGCSKGGLAVVDVTDGSDVQVWLGALEPAS